MKTQLILMHLALWLLENTVSVTSLLRGTQVRTGEQGGQRPGQGGVPRPLHLTETLDSLKKTILFILLLLISDAFQVSFATERI